jgi:serine/threonine protein kinase
MQTQFLDVQTVVLTKGLDLEKDERKRHIHFSRDETMPFEVGAELGGGRFSQVHKITSSISKQEYARKKFRRGVGFRNESEIKSFKVELQVLKKIHHHHCVELVRNAFPVFHRLESSRIVLSDSYTGCQLHGFEVVRIDYLPCGRLQFEGVLRYYYQ